MVRCDEPGWVMLAQADERRGLWIRIRKHSIELCAGREGDDGYVKIDSGEVLCHQTIAQTIAQVVELVDMLEWAREQSSCGACGAPIQDGAEVCVREGDRNVHVRVEQTKAVKVL